MRAWNLSMRLCFVKTIWLMRKDVTSLSSVSMPFNSALYSASMAAFCEAMLTLLSVVLVLMVVAMIGSPCRATHEERRAGERRRLVLAPHLVPVFLRPKLGSKSTEGRRLVGRCALGVVWRPPAREWPGPARLGARGALFRVRDRRSRARAVLVRARNALLSVREAHDRAGDVPIEVR